MVRAASVTPEAICLWMTQGWFRMSPAVRKGGVVGRCEQSLTSGLPKPITAPCGSLTQLVPTQAPLQGHVLRFS
jgi:hypothetical protein